MTMSAYKNFAPYSQQDDTLSWVRPAQPHAVPPNVADKDGLTPLMRAAEKGDTATLRRLIADGADLNAGDKSGLTALMRAVKARQVKPAAELITAGANINAETRNGWTALSLAVKSGSPLMISLIANAQGKAD
jgi:ankyrin repeat protein